ncbi:hypothetical protein JCM10914_3749 [Paenibacillus sp. JCM 10914]|nr:hypothetical protein JCM10914_3749 [Paenibacillus sp. JCM 10914]
MQFHVSNRLQHFFGILKSEFLYYKAFENVEHFKEELKKYIEYYNNETVEGKNKNESGTVPNSF